ncbi:MAG: glycosyltransferase family 39 protein [Thermoflavifilum sp.]|nr:glycosyltransferase family 39 protein [Thermoflavifilum sp.]MCL6514454.1 glycosyltransferase family 39 protein [Alicyclobacillus sp.]
MRPDASPIRPARQLDVGAVVILVIALITRLWFAYRHPTYSLWGDDMRHYDHLARMILTRHIYAYWGDIPDAFVTPGFPLFLAFCYWLASHISPSSLVGLHVTYLVQAVVATAGCVGLYMAARRWLGRLPALVTALLWCAYYPAVWATSLPLTECLYVSLLLLFLWAWTAACSTGQPGLWFSAGVLLALTTLVRPVTLPFVVVTAFTAWWLERSASQRRAWRSALIHVVGFILCMLPWWIRNAVVLHRLLLTDDDSANPLLFGSFPDMRVPAGFQPPADQKALAIHRIVEGFTQQPGLYLRWYTVGKIDWLYAQPWVPQGMPAWLHAFTQAEHWVILVLGAIGIVVGLFRRRIRWWSVLALFLVLVQLPFLPLARYAFPTMPLFCLGVGIALRTIRARDRTTRTPATEAPWSRGP